MKANPDRNPAGVSHSLARLCCRCTRFPGRVTCQLQHRWASFAILLGGLGAVERAMIGDVVNDRRLLSGDGVEPSMLRGALFAFGSRKAAPAHRANGAVI
jgi:hypothetical protein